MNIDSNGDDAFITRHYLDLPLRELSRQLGRSRCYVEGRLAAMGLCIPAEVLMARRLRAQKAKGNVPPNKGKRQEQYLDAAALLAVRRTRFVRGHMPGGRVCPVGQITARAGAQGRKYLYVRAEGGRWHPLHHIVWAHHHGACPAGHIIAFKDGDPANCTIENLECISQEENMARNSWLRYGPEVGGAIRLQGALSRQIHAALLRLEKGKNDAAASDKSLSPHSQNGQP